MKATASTAISVLLALLLQGNGCRAPGDASSEEDSGKQPAILVGQYGQGRIFHTILEHDAAAVKNHGFQSLVLRAAEWASGGPLSASGQP